MYPKSAESRVTLGKAPERDPRAGRPLKRKTTWESKKAQGLQVPAPRPPCRWCPPKAGAAGPFKGQGSAPARRADPGTAGGRPAGLAAALCARQVAPPAARRSSPALFGGREGPGAAALPSPTPGPPPRTVGPSSYRRRPPRAPHRRSLQRAAAVGPVQRTLRARGRPCRRRSGSGGPRRAPCAVLRSGGPGAAGRGAAEPAAARAGRSVRGAPGRGAHSRAAGRTDGWLLARRRGLDRGGDSCLGPLGLL